MFSEAQWHYLFVAMDPVLDGTDSNFRSWDTGGSWLGGWLSGGMKLPLAACIDIRTVSAGAACANDTIILILLPFLRLFLPYSLYTTKRQNAEYTNDAECRLCRNPVPDTEHS